MIFTLPSIEHPVGVQEDGSPRMVRFYPISAQLASTLRAVVGPLAQALMILFQNEDRDQAERIKQTPTEMERSVLAIDPALAKERHDQRQKAASLVIEGLMSQQSLGSLAEVIMDSLRDDYPVGKPRTPEDVKKFLRETPLPLMTPLVIGVAKANAGLFGPFADLVSADAIRALRKKILAGQEAPAAAEAPRTGVAESPAPAPEEVPQAAPQPAP